MMLGRKSVAVAFLVVATAMAQQPNTFGATMTVEDIDGPTYPMTGVAVRTNTVVEIDVRGFAFQPFLIALSASNLLQQFSAPLWGDKLDIPFNPPANVWMNGFSGPGIATFKTGPLGELTIPVSIPSNLALNSTRALQAAVADFTSSFGLSLTAATQTVTTQGPVITNHVLGGDNFATISLTGWSLPVYGTSYTTLYLDADGYMVMGAQVPIGEFSSTPAQMNAGPPRIAGFWADLDQLAGTIRTTIDASPIGDFPYIFVEFISVADWSGVGFNHSFSFRANNQGWIEISSPFNNNLSIFETLVCLAPGNNNNIGAMLDLTNVQDVAPNYKIGAVNEQFYEWFGQTTMPSYSLGVNRPYDLIGRTLKFFPNYTPPGGGVPTIADMTKSYIMY